LWGFTQYIEQSLGYKTTFDSKTGEDQHQAHVLGVPLFPAEAIRTMPKDTALLLSSNRKGMKLKMLPYFQHPDLLALSKKPPFQTNYPEPDNELHLLFDEL
jgi:type IV secretory pathway TraG/TraD family ATPase VirD4